MTEPVPVLKGTLDVLVLKALSWRPMHGLEITDCWPTGPAGNWPSTSPVCTRRCTAWRAGA